jgi:hypothetical protein
MLLVLVHVHHTYAFHGQCQYVATLHANLTELDIFTTLEKKCSRLHLSAQLSGPRDPPQFLSQHNHWSSALKPNICWWTGYIGLLGTYLQHVISMFNTCSQGANPSVLNRHRWGLQPWRRRLSTTHSPPFLTDGHPLSTQEPHPVLG